MHACSLETAKCHNDLAVLPGMFSVMLVAIQSNSDSRPPRLGRRRCSVEKLAEP